MAAVSGEVRLVPGEEREARPRSADWLFPAVVAAIAALALLAAAWGVAFRGGASRSLPREERTALVARSVDELRRFCGEGRPESLRDHCREVASFVAQFDECDGACAALVRRQLTPAPTR